MKRSDQAQRPGVMLYFDLWPSLKRLDLEEKGRLLEAVLEYAQWSVQPDFGEDLLLALVWDFVRPRIDRDGERYEDIVQKRRHAVYIREEKKKGREPLDYEEWLERERAGDQTVSCDIKRHPTANPNSNLSSSSAPATAAAPPAENIYQFTAPTAWEGRKLTPRQQVQEFEALRRESIRAVAGWRG